MALRSRYPQSRHAVAVFCVDVGTTGQKRPNTVYISARSGFNEGLCVIISGNDWGYYGKNKK